MKKLVTLTIIATMLVIMSCMTAMASASGHPNGAASVAKIDSKNDGGYSDYFRINNPNNPEADGMYCYDNSGIPIFECWICDDAPGGDGSWYLSMQRGMLVGLVHDNYNDKWYFLRDNGKLAMTSGNYQIETINPGDQRDFFPFTFGKTTKYLEINPANGEIKNLAMGEAERNHYYYETIDKTMFDEYTKQKGYAPCIYTSKMNEYSREYLDAIAKQGITPRRAIEDGYRLTEENLTNDENAFAAMQENANNIYYDECGFLCTASSPEEAAAKNKRGRAYAEITNTDRIDTRYLLKNGIVRYGLPSWTKY